MLSWYAAPASKRGAGGAGCAPPPPGTRSAGPAQLTVIVATRAQAGFTAVRYSTGQRLVAVTVLELEAKLIVEHKWASHR